MTTKAYKRMCRHKVEFYAKLITYVMVTVVGLAAYFLHINMYLTFIIINTVWFWGGDAAAYVLENFYKIKHIKGIYR